MAVPRQNTLEDNQAFLMNIGYLAVINGRGPFSGNFVQSAIGQYGIRENIKDVLVGDDAYSGNEWGKVISKSGDVTNGFTFEVKFNNTVMPAGIDHATWNPSRVQKYASMLPPAATVTGLVNNNAWQKVASIGVLIVRSTAAPDPIVLIDDFVILSLTGTVLSFKVKNTLPTTQYLLRIRDASNAVINNTNFTLSSTARDFALDGAGYNGYSLDTLFFTTGKFQIMNQAGTTPLSEFFSKF